MLGVGDDPVDRLTARIRELQKTINMYVKGLAREAEKLRNKVITQDEYNLITDTIVSNIEKCQELQTELTKQLVDELSKRNSKGVQK